MTSPDDKKRPSKMKPTDTVMEALRNQEVDAVVGENEVQLLRLREVEHNLRESEERLRELNKTLEERIAERTAELEQQTHNLRQLTYELTNAEQRERKRLAHMLHDGLQQILMAVEINLTMISAENNSEELEQAHQLVREAVQVSRSLAYELAPPVLYESSFNEALAWLARWFKAKHHFTVRVGIVADTITLTENAKVFLFNAIRELLLNSVKHSGVQEAAVRCTRVEDEWWQIEVRDKGKGFDPANFHSAYLQDEFNLERGFGLLSIRERLVALGGSLKIVSKPGVGTHFTIRYPVSTSEQAESQLQKEAPRKQSAASGLAAREKDRNVRILLVDDHQVVREALATMLQKLSNFEIVGEAGNGHEAVDLAETLQPDVILMDINMPYMDGIEATRRIKEKHPAIHIIGLSMHEEADKAPAMRQAGATAYLQKDTAAETLVETITKL